jgi:hypothetical protein
LACIFNQVCWLFKRLQHAFNTQFTLAINLLTLTDCFPELHQSLTELSYSRFERIICQDRVVEDVGSLCMLVDAFIHLKRLLVHASSQKAIDFYDRI